MTDYPTSGKGFLAESDSQSIEKNARGKINYSTPAPNDIFDVSFAKPQTIQQADMLEALESLSPQQRTELVTDWYLFWVTFHTQLAMGVE